MSRTDADGLDLPPISIEAEQAVLGAALANNFALDRCPWLDPAHFGEPVHGRIWQAMRDAVGRGERADPVLLQQLFEHDPALRELDGAKYLASLARLAEPMSTVVDYARHVVYLARLREMGEICANMRLALFDRARLPDPATVFAEHRERLEALCRDDTRPAAKHVAMVLDDLAASCARPAELWPTGIPLLDESLGGGIQPGYVIGVEARPKSFKAQPVTEPVLLRDGTWKPIGDLRIGDDLASPDGAPSRVVGVYPQGTRKAFRVRTSDGRSVLADAEHLWSVRTKNTSSGKTIELIVTTERLGEMLVRTRPVWLPQASGHFGGHDLPVDPYLLGVLLGDGGLSGSTVRVTMADPDMVANLSAVVPAGNLLRQHGKFDYCFVTGVGYGDSRSYSRQNFLKMALRDLGLMGKRAEAKFIPAIYLGASRADRVRLLQGLVDTDAQVNFGMANFTTTSCRLAEDIQRLAWSLGMIARQAKPMASWYSANGERKAGQTVYRVMIRAEDPFELCTLPRKRRQLVAKRVHKTRLCVVAVEPADEHEMVCIRVSHPSSLYVTRDYVLTHNSGCAHTILLALARQRVPCCYFALEMGSVRLVQRMLAQIGGFNSAAFRHRSEEKDRKWLVDRIETVRPELDPVPMWFEDRPAIKFSQLRGTADQMLQAYGVRVFVLDYWQLVASDRPVRNKPDFLGEVAQWCADHAHAHGTTWLICSQENRGGESLGSDGLARACDWHAVLHKHEQKFWHAQLDRWVETLWMDVKWARDSSGDSIGDEEKAALFIHPHGPHLRQLPAG